MKLKCLYRAMGNQQIKCALETHHAHFQAFGELYYMQKKKKDLWRFTELVNIFILTMNIITMYMLYMSTNPCIKL